MFFFCAQTSNCSRVGLKNGTTAKRKLKERKQVRVLVTFSYFYLTHLLNVFTKFQGILDSDSSSDDIFGGNARRSNVSNHFTLKV